MATVDTNALLSIGLRAAEAWESAEPGSPAEFAAAETVSGMLLQLHRELREGAVLPTIWHLAQPPLVTGPNCGAGIL